MEQEDGPFHFPQREVPNSICDDDRLSLSRRLENDPRNNHVQDRQKGSLALARERSRTVST
jgi:hypothetical protein